MYLVWSTKQRGSQTKVVIKSKRFKWLIHVASNIEWIIKYYFCTKQRRAQKPNPTALIRYYLIGHWARKFMLTWDIHGNMYIVYPLKFASKQMIIPQHFDWDRSLIRRINSICPPCVPIATCFNVMFLLLSMLSSEFIY